MLNFYQKTKKIIYIVLSWFWNGYFLSTKITNNSCGWWTNFFSVTTVSNKFVLNGDTFLQPKFNFKGAYLFDVFKIPVCKLEN